MSRLSFILNYAPHYREAVYKLIDKSFDCRFYFGDRLRENIKKMGYDNFSGAVEELQTRWLFGNWCYYKGWHKVLKDRSDVYILTGDMRNLSNWLILLCLKLFYPKRKGMVWTHGTYKKERGVSAIVKRVFYALCDGILCYGNYAKEIMVRGGMSANKIYVIHNSLNHEVQVGYRVSAFDSDLYKEHFGNNNPVLIFTGRLTKVKRLDMIIEAMTILCDRGERYNLVLVGDGAEREALQQLASVRKLSDSIWFYGACYDENELSKLIYNADLCVAPGNVGLTAMHVMSYGTPVVTHNDFALQMPEFEAIKEGVTGDFFACNDVVDMANTISRWFAVGRDRKSVREACYAEIDNYWTPKFQVDVIRTILREQDNA